MLDFGAVKCDLFCACEVSFSIKMVGKIRIIGVNIVNCDLIVQIRMKILRRPFRGRYWIIIHIKRDKIYSSSYCPSLWRRK